MVDTVNLNIYTPTGTDVGGEVSNGDGYSTDPTASINGNAVDNDYSFVVLNLDDLPSYAVNALQNGSANLTLTFQAHTSDIVPVTVKAYAADELFPGYGTIDPAVTTQVASPSTSNADYVVGAFADNSSTSIAQVTVKDSAGPASPSQNENTPQTVDITSQALSILKYGDSNLVVYFHESGATPGFSVNVTNVSASIVGPTDLVDTFANSSSTRLVGSVVTHPFADVTVASQLPASLQTNGGGTITINPASPNTTSTDFVDASTATTGSNDYLIVQTNPASGTLSGQGLSAFTSTPSNMLSVPKGDVGYVFSGTAAQATTLLQNLVFTPSAAGPSQTTPTTFYITEATLFDDIAYANLANLNPIEIDTGSVTGASIGIGVNQLVTTGGVADETALSGNLTANGSVYAVYGTQTITSGGVANGTAVEAGIVTVESGGTTNNTALGKGGAVSYQNISTPSQENVLAGGVANGTTIATQALQILTGNALAVGTTIHSEGLQTVGSGSTAKATHILSDGVETIAAGGFGAQTVIDAGGIQNVSGVVSDATVSGVQNVLDGGRANNTTVASGGVQNDAGSTTNTQVQAGGVENVAASATAAHTSITGTNAVLALASGASATDVTVNTSGLVTAAGTVTLAGLSGAGALRQTGSGALTLSGSGAFLGTATVSGGTLSVASDGSLGDARSTIVLAGGDLDVGDKFHSQSSIALRNESAVQVDGGTATLSGVISGAGTLLKSGAGTLALSGANSFSGGISLEGGTLELVAAGAAGTGVIAFTPGGEVLKIDGAAGLSNVIKSFDGDDTLDLSGLAYTSGASATLTGSTLVVTSGSASETFTHFSVAGVKIGAAGGDYTLAVASDGAHGSALSLKPTPVTGDSGGGDVAPLFSGVKTSQFDVVPAPVTPFAGLTLTDSNAGATDVLTITQTGGGALTDGAAFSGLSTTATAGVYTLSGTAASVTAELDALVFTPSAGAAETLANTTFSLSDETSVHTSATAGTITVTSSTPAADPSFSGVVMQQAVQNSAPSTPFGTVTLADSNGGALDELTITQTGTGALTDGVGFSGLTATSTAGVYTLSGTAAAITAEVEALVFTPVAAGVSTVQSTSFALSDVSSAGTTGSVGDIAVTDTTTAVSPVFSGEDVSQTTSNAASVHPFGTVMLSDANVGAVELVTITQTGAGVLTDGNGFSGLTATATAGVYTLSGAAAAITSELDAVIFTPAAGTPNTTATTTFALSDASSADTTVLAPTISVAYTTPAAAPSSGGGGGTSSGTGGATGGGGTSSGTGDAGGGATSSGTGGAGGGGTSSGTGDAGGGVTLTGDATAAVLQGSADADTLTAGSSSDTLLGGGGDDHLIGGSGSAMLYGNAGNDLITLTAATQSSTVYGGQGNDVIDASASTHANFISGDLGNDTVHLGAGADTAYGGAGDDTVIAGSGQDQIYGNTGNDHITLGSATLGSTVYGGQGDDVIDASASTHANFISGDLGNDTVQTGSGADTAYGGAGDDSLLGGAGHDQLYGNAGNDIITLGDLNLGSTVYGGQGNDVIDASASTHANYISGDLGNDMILAGSGGDTIYGGEGSDTIQAASGAATFIHVGLADSSAVSATDMSQLDHVTHFNSQTQLIFDGDPAATSANTTFHGGDAAITSYEAAYAYAYGSGTSAGAVTGVMDYAVVSDTTGHVYIFAQDHAAVEIDGLAAGVNGVTAGQILAG